MQTEASPKNKAGRGGLRLGAGRKPGSRNRKLKGVESVIEKKIPLRERIEILADIARNAKRATERERAVRQLNEYQLGKPVERSEISVPSNRPVPVALIPPIVRPKEEEEEKG